MFGTLYHMFEVKTCLGLTSLISEIKSLCLGLTTLISEVKTLCLGLTTLWHCLRSKHYVWGLLPYDIVWGQNIMFGAYYLMSEVKTCLGLTTLCLKSKHVWGLLPYIKSQNIMLGLTTLCLKSNPYVLGLLHYIGSHSVMFKLTIWLTTLYWGSLPHNGAEYIMLGE
jgi:hypothetical protein